jgi:hypothetical protein
VICPGPARVIESAPYYWNETQPARLLGWERETVEDLPIVLVVDDDPLIQSFAEETLTDGGFEIVIASSGEDAIDLLDAGKAKYRAMVTDINLGRDKLTGWDVARRAREIDAGFPVVYMTVNRRGVPTPIGELSCCYSVQWRGQSWGLTHI